MNKFFEFEDILKETENYRDTLISSAKTLERRIEEIKDLCDHTNKDGTSSINWENDRGHGHIIYTCNICGKFGNRNWFEKLFISYKH